MLRENGSLRFEPGCFAGREPSRKLPMVASQRCIPGGNQRAKGEESLNANKEQVKKNRMEIRPDERPIRCLHAVIE
jgi:hypothetical protein